MPSTRPFLVDLPRVAREGPEATPLTSHASTFWLSPSADSQTRNSLCSRPLRAYSHLENRESRNSLEVSQSCGLKKRPLVQQTSSGPAATCAADLFGPSSHLENRERVAPAEPTVSGGLRNFTRSHHSPAIAG